MKKNSLVGFFLSLILPLVSISQVFQSQIQTNYAFTGNGKWSLASNWLNSKKPPGLVPKGDTVFIRSSSGDSCLLDVTQYLAEGAVLKVDEGSRLIVTGDILTFVPAEPTFTDPRDSKVYPIKKYSNKIWMTANLDYIHPNPVGVNYSVYYDNNKANGPIFGRLYTWEAAMNACPAGWHLPSSTDWSSLIELVGGGGVLKDTLYWNAPNTGATNLSSFNARPGGTIFNGSFEDKGYEGIWWTSTYSTSTGVIHWATVYHMRWNSALVSNWEGEIGEIYSVRCVKD